MIAATNPDEDSPNKPGKDDEPGTDAPGDNTPDKDDQKPGTGDKESGDNNDDQSNKDNADNNGSDNDATNNVIAPNAENVIPATGDATSTIAIASLLIACCALVIAAITKRKQFNL